MNDKEVFRDDNTTWNWFLLSQEVKIIEIRTKENSCLYTLNTPWSYPNIAMSVAHATCKGAKLSLVPCQFTRGEVLVHSLWSKTSASPLSARNKALLALPSSWCDSYLYYITGEEHRLPKSAAKHLWEQQTLWASLNINITHGIQRKGSVTPNPGFASNQISIQVAG